MLNKSIYSHIKKNDSDNQKKYWILDFGLDNCLGDIFT